MFPDLMSVSQYSVHRCRRTDRRVAGGNVPSTSLAGEGGPGALFRAGSSVSEVCRHSDDGNSMREATSNRKGAVVDERLISW